MPHISAISKDIATGQADTGVEVSGSNVIRIQIFIQSDRLDEFWVEYGQDATNLNLRTERTSSGLGMINPMSYGIFTRTIPESELEPEKLYFYRAAARTGNETVYGSVSAFQAPK